MPNFVAITANRDLARKLAMLVAVLGVGLALGACTKCDVPTWTPSSCHDGPKPQ
jgi:hypothetical protein